MDRSARRFHWDLFGIFYVELSGSPGSYWPAVPQLNKVGSQGAFVRRYPTIAFVCGRCSAFPFDTAGRRASFFGEIHFLVKKNFWLNLNQFSDPSTYVEGFVLGRSFDKRLADNHLKLGRRHRQFIDWRCCRRVEVVRIVGGLSCEQDVAKMSAHGGMPAPAARVLHFWIISGFTSPTIQWRRLCHGSANLGLDGWRSFHARVVLSLLTFPARGVWSFPNTQIPHVVAICPSPLSLHSVFFIITESNMFSNKWTCVHLHFLFSKWTSSRPPLFCIWTSA
jgi:hypothetical protein